MNYTEFENKVKSMTAHDIIMAMVDGLRQPRTKIAMWTFGKMENGICYGCAATNAILHIMEADEDEVEDYICGCEPFADKDFALWHFENAIDYLRRGNLILYNQYSEECGFAQITPIPGQELPWLDDDYTEAKLQQYEKLAKYQLTAKTTKNEKQHD